MAGTDRKRATRGRLAAALSAAVKMDQDGGTQRTRSVPICPLSVMKSIKDSVDEGSRGLHLAASAQSGACYESVTG